MWDERYSGSDYVYGTVPNSFLAENVGRLHGKVLSLAEGEGRNAVFLASHGLNVYGVDASEIGLAKAQALARKKHVTIQTEVVDLAHFEPQPDSFDAVVSIFAHLSSVIRHRLYPGIVRSLKTNGIILLESYSERQIHRDTGGPKDLDMLLTCEKIEKEFPTLEPILLREVARDVTEGRFHTGMASVVQYIARKP